MTAIIWNSIKKKGEQLLTHSLFAGATILTQLYILFFILPACVQGSENTGLDVKSYKVNSELNNKRFAAKRNSHISLNKCFEFAKS